MQPCCYRRSGLAKFRGSSLMRVRRTATIAFILGNAMLPLTVYAAAESQPAGHRSFVSAPTFPVSQRAASGRDMSFRHALFYPSISLKSSTRQRGPAVVSSGISCVPYARSVSGIMVAGNAWQWWENAAGQYARGDRPEAGSVLNFRSNGRMRLGHVAVVTRVVNAREVIVDQANWPSAGMRGGVSHDVAVVDVSAANNWSAVRVELGQRGEYGSVYPAYGFIYNRPDTGIVSTSVTRPAPLPNMNPVPSDLRPVAERPWQIFEEVAESPSAAAHRIDLRAKPGAGR